MMPTPSHSPLTLTPRNVEHALGVKWRWVCELADRHGIAVWRVRGKRLLPAGPVLDALRREAEVEQAAPALAHADDDEAQAERYREAIGMQRRR